MSIITHNCSTPMFPSTFNDSSAPFSYAEKSILAMSLYLSDTRFYRMINFWRIILTFLSKDIKCWAKLKTLCHTDYYEGETVLEEIIITRSDLPGNVFASRGLFFCWTPRPHLDVLWEDPGNVFLKRYIAQNDITIKSNVTFKCCMLSIFCHTSAGRLANSKCYVTR